MHAMRSTLLILGLMFGVAPAFSASPPLTEQSFRKAMGVSPDVKLAFRDLDCKAVDFDGFAMAMHEPNAHADVDRAVDGSAITMTVRLRGNSPCPSAYPPITSMPPFALKDLAGKVVTDKSLRGKPTLISFFFSTCKPCILEVDPLNHFATERPQMNFLSVTFDESEVAREFVNRFGVKWRVVPNARDFIDRVRVKNYPTVALFDADGKLLGMKNGGARDALEAANVEPQMKRWVEGLLHK